jgi:propanol-preferring alcohol dehydrogenase
MKAYRLLSRGRARLVEVDEPTPGPGEARVRVLAAGVCRTDLALLHTGAPRLPVTLGHEIVGEVVELGPGVSGLEPGTAVAVYELIGCGECGRCARGEDNLCREAPPEVAGVTRDGGMAEQVVVPARNLVALGAIDPVAAAPLTDAGMTAKHAIERGRPWLNEDATAVVIGIGGLGHLALQVLRATSQARIIAVDVDAAHLALAEELGATEAVAGGDAAGDRLVEANGARQVDVVFDFVGSQQTLDLAARVTGRGGAIVVAGGGGGRLFLSAEMGTGRFPEREVTMIHTFAGTRDDLIETLALAKESRIDSRVQTFGLEDAGRALAELEAGRVLGRAVITPGADA